jgi:Flp pilus assembly protein TadG
MTGLPGNSRIDRGNMLIEFALSSSLLFLVMFGVIDFSRIFSSACKVQGAARAGTQYGMLSPAHYNDFTGMQNAAQANAGSPAGMTATASQFCACSIGGTQQSCPPTCSTGSPETYIQMVVSMPYTTTFTYPGIPHVINLAGSSAVRVQ